MNKHISETVCKRYKTIGANFHGPLTPDATDDMLIALRKTASMLMSAMEIIEFLCPDHYEPGVKLLKAWKEDNE